MCCCCCRRKRLPCLPTPPSPARPLLSTSWTCLPSCWPGVYYCRSFNVKLHAWGNTVSSAYVAHVCSGRRGSSAQIIAAYAACTVVWQSVTCALHMLRSSQSCVKPLASHRWANLVATCCCCAQVRNSGRCGERLEAELAGSVGTSL
jgi:hypothetical protein